MFLTDCVSNGTGGRTSLSWSISHFSTHYWSLLAFVLGTTLPQSPSHPLHYSWNALLDFGGLWMADKLMATFWLLLKHSHINWGVCLFLHTLAWSLTRFGLSFVFPRVLLTFSSVFSLSQSVSTAPLVFLQLLHLRCLMTQCIIQFPCWLEDKPTLIRKDGSSPSMEMWLNAAAVWSGPSHSSSIGNELAFTIKPCTANTCTCPVPSSSTISFFLYFLDLCWTRWHVT